MELDALIQHFFGCDNPAELTQSEFDLALERIAIAFGVEREAGRKFALWCLMEALGTAPPPAEAFVKEPALKAAAEEYLKAAFRTEREGGHEQ